MSGRAAYMKLSLPYMKHIKHFHLGQSYHKQTRPDPQLTLQLRDVDSAAHGAGYVDAVDQRPLGLFLLQVGVRWRQDVIHHLITWFLFLTHIKVIVVGATEFTV